MIHRAKPLKRLRTGLESSLADGTAAAPGTMPSSQLGARPLVDTPTGTPTVPAGADVPSTPPMGLPQSIPSIAPSYDSRPPVLDRPVPVFPPTPYPSQSPQYSQPPQHQQYSQAPAERSPSQPYASQQPRYAVAGLTKASPHLATKLGVAPPPERPSKPHPVTAARRSESKVWLIIGLALVVASTAALVLAFAA